MRSTSTPVVVSKKHPLKYGKWGNNCDAWSLLQNKKLTVKHERMPEGAEEVLHYHEAALQFFFILKGKAVFEIDEVILVVHEGEGLQIDVGKKHRLMNRDEGFLEFLVCSQPSTLNDRFNLV